MSQCRRVEAHSVRIKACAGSLASIERPAIVYNLRSAATNTYCNYGPISLDMAASSESRTKKLKFVIPAIGSVVSVRCVIMAYDSLVSPPCSNRRSPSTDGICQSELYGMAPQSLVVARV